MCGYNSNYDCDCDFNFEEKVNNIKGIGNVDDRGKFYWWVRVFDWNDETKSTETNTVTINSEDCVSQDDSEGTCGTKWFNIGKGALLDEFYVITSDKDRELVKDEVRQKYGKIGFAKPRNGKSGVYAIVEMSSKSWHDRFYCKIDTICLNDRCHKPVNGIASEFPRLIWSDYSNPKNFFCSHECKRSVTQRMSEEGEWQSKEEMNETSGYIYHIYNRKLDEHYIGQTRFLPFFRWQEHMKSGYKGNLVDCTFEVLTEVKKLRNATTVENQSYINNIEAWWIRKYIADGLVVMNSTVPKLTLEYLHDEFDKYLNSKGMVILGMTTKDDVDVVTITNSNNSIKLEDAVQSGCSTLKELLGVIK